MLIISLISIWNSLQCLLYVGGRMLWLVLRVQCIIQVYGLYIVYYVWLTGIACSWSIGLVILCLECNIQIFNFYLRSLPDIWSQFSSPTRGLPAGFSFSNFFSVSKRWLLLLYCRPLSASVQWRTRKRGLCRCFVMNFFMYMKWIDYKYKRSVGMREM